MSTADLSPEYLLTLSKRVDVLSRHSLALRLGPLTQEFSALLNSQFSELGSMVTLYHQDPIMKESSYIRCKTTLELYCIQKVAALLEGESSEIAQVMTKAITQISDSMSRFENLILAERGSKTQMLDQEKDRIIKGMRKELLEKREYTRELEERYHELDDENTKIYSKLIANAKQSASFSSTSPSKIRQFFSPDRNSSVKKKHLPLRHYEEEVYEILESKIKQESIQDRRSSLDDYVQIYFKVKYGKPLAEQNEVGFREVVANLAKKKEKVAFVMFQAMLDQECEEAYYLEQKQFQDKAVRNTKRFFHQVKGKNLDDLEKLLDLRDDKNDIVITQNDVEPLLGAIYKSSQVDTLQLIMNQLLNQTDAKITVKRLLNEVLLCQLRKHMMRIEEILREIDRLPNREGKMLNFSQVEYLLARLSKDPSRLESLQKRSDQLGNRSFTIGEAVELVEKILWTRSK